MSHIKEKQEVEEPKRIKYAIDALTAKGIEVRQINEHALQFIHKGHIVNFFPYTGWFSGKSVKDGRGISKLLKQL